MMIEKIAELLTDHDPNPRQGVFWFGSVRFGLVTGLVTGPVRSGRVGSGQVRSDWIRVRRFSNVHGLGPFTVARPDLTWADLTHEVLA